MAINFADPETNIIPVCTVVSRCARRCSVFVHIPIVFTGGGGKEVDMLAV